MVRLVVVIVALVFLTVYGTSAIMAQNESGEAQKLSPPQVIKIPAFEGSLPARPIYIYMPRGYAEQTEKQYPVIYMHDGQNCFQQFVSDAAFGNSWRADEVATRLMDTGKMRECLIVGVGNGGDQRIPEYLPPYASFFLTRGRADATALHLINEVAPYVAANYRVLAGRENTATLGSSMGGVLTTYIAWEYPEFARHHASVSPAYWIMRDVSGRMEIVERLRTQERRDIRMYLDSGTIGGAPTLPADDGLRETMQARDAMLECGYIEGKDFRFMIDEGGIHSETSWAARLDVMLMFLMPVCDEMGS